MKTPFSVVILVFFIFMAIQRVWETFFKIKKETGKIINKWSLNILISIHIIIVLVCLGEYFLRKNSINLIISTCGFILYCIALIGRNWSMNTLGKWHSPHVEIRDNHALIIKGPYKYFRHPYYLSVILEFIGFPLVANSYYALCLSLFLYIPALYVLRVYSEEKAMTNKFGKEYIQYTKTVFGFCPLKNK
jgi:protein-S-isoprenylcysteine O-methyltransferase Ste14